MRFYRIPSVFDMFHEFDTIHRGLSKSFLDFDRFFSEFDEKDNTSGERHTFVNGMLVKKESSDGTTEYYQNGKLHNLTGPAVVKKDGTKEYWLNGRVVSESDIKAETQKIEEAKTTSYQLNITKSEKEKIEKALGRKLE